MLSVSLPSIALALIAFTGVPNAPSAKCNSAATCTSGNSAYSETISRYGPWFIVQTVNFQVCCDESESSARRVARHAETLRTELRLKWLGSSSAEGWNPKCQIVIHTNQRRYVAAVGPGSERTVGSSLVNVEQGRVTSRRIDLFRGQTEILSAALPHELTHVVLQERFTSMAVPRWADEGSAILADPKAKQSRHTRDLNDALMRGHTFAAAALLTMDEYPRAERLGTFYGQSASMTEFLTAKKNPAQFVRFVDSATRRGYDAALREFYDIANVAELDRQWRLHVAAPRVASVRTLSRIGCRVKAAPSMWLAGSQCW